MLLSAFLLHARTLGVCILAQTWLEGAHMSGNYFFGFMLSDWMKLSLTERLTVPATFLASVIIPLPRQPHEISSLELWFNVLTCIVWYELEHPNGWGLDGPQPLPTIPIDPLTISINVFVNDLPLARREGTKLTSQLIKDCIFKEAETNVTLTVLPGPSSDSLELCSHSVHLGILLEVLCWEGFKLSVGLPKAVLITNPNCSGIDHLF